MRPERLPAPALLIVLLLVAGCSFEDRPGAAATAARAAATALPTRAVSTPTATRPASPTRTATPVPPAETEIEQSVTAARSKFERVLGSAALPGIEDLLIETVALATPGGGEQLARANAARWLRQRATGRIRVLEFQRHQHQALIIAATQGWTAVAPVTTSQLGFTLRRYDRAGAPDPEHGDWLIDVIEVE